MKNKDIRNISTVMTEINKKSIKKMVKYNRKLYYQITDNGKLILLNDKFCFAE